MLEEVQIRKRAGQYQLAAAFIARLRTDRLSLESKLEIERRLSEIVEGEDKAVKTLEWVR